MPVHHLDPVAWITDGGQLGWTEPLLRAADLIVWLDLPLRVTLPRTVARHRGRGPAWLAARMRLQLAWHLRPCGTETDLDHHPGRAATRVQLAPHAARVLRLRANPDAGDVLARRGSV